MAEQGKIIRQKLLKFANRIAEIQRESLIEASQLAKEHLNVRIFDEGKDVDNQKIGDYSTNQLLVPKSAFIRKSALNKKEAKIVKRTSPKRGWIFLQGGYKQLRELNGRPTKFVNLNYRGDLKRSIKTQRKGKNQINVVIKGNENVKKARLNEDHFNKDIFGLTQEAKKKIDDIIRKKVREELQKI